MKAYFFWLAKLITFFVILIVAIPTLILAIAGAKSAKLDGVTDEKSHKVAVVELNGMIEDSKEILKELYDRAADKNIPAIVLRINSPGGVVGPSQDIYDAVKNIKTQKPVVVSMGSVAASGGLYAALGASKIYCQPGTLTGSIGVIMQLPNFARVTEKVGVTMTTIKSGKFKDVGNSFRDMTPEEQEFIQGTVNEIYGIFVKAVVDGRNIPEEKVREFADGRVILGSQAVELGLVDATGTVYDAAREALKLAGRAIDAKQMPELLYKDQNFDKFKKFFESVVNLPVYLENHLNAVPQAKFVMN